MILNPLLVKNKILANQWHLTLRTKFESRLERNLVEIEAIANLQY